MIGSTAMQLVTVSERPDLVGPAWEQTSDTIPEYNNHGDTLNRYWGRLTSERPDFQFHLLGDNDELLARVRSIPVRWDGSIDDLPAGSTARSHGGSKRTARTRCAHSS